MHLNNILHKYSINEKECVIESLSSGLINSTWKVTCGSKKYILQKINNTIFKKPELIADNLESLSDYLKNHPEYLFVAPLINNIGNTLTFDENRSPFRMFPFIENSYTVNNVSNAEQAFEAAAQFGKFTSMLKDFDAEKLNITLPDFHNIALRYRQFSSAAQNGNPARIHQSQALINQLKKYKYIIEEYEQIKLNPNFKLRVTHHDTKISNVLFDKNENALCVIDLDTVMPGYFISDVGDMMRTYLSPSTEEDTDLSKIEIREDVFAAIINGYLEHTKDILTRHEKEKFFYAGTFLIYMQALRFTTDFLNNDVYYGAKYPEHNLNRAENQFCLLQRLIEKEQILSLLI